MRFCLIDTGPIVALFDKSDQYHEKAIKFISSYKGSLITSLATITETLYLLDFDQNAQIAFLKWVESGQSRLNQLTKKILIH